MEFTQLRAVLKISEETYLVLIKKIADLGNYTLKFEMRMSNV